MPPSPTDYITVSVVLDLDNGLMEITEKRMDGQGSPIVSSAAIPTQGFPFPTQPA